MNSTNSVERKRLIGLIHLAKKQLLDNDDTAYRDLLHDLTGKRSCTQLTLEELRDTYAALQRRGFVPQPKAGSKGRKYSPASTHKPRKQAKDKVRALWISLHKAGIVRDGSEIALAHFCKNLVGVDSPDWLEPNQARIVIEALKKMGVNQDVPAT
jgi:phage gp16-like protein